MAQSSRKRQSESEPHWLEWIIGTVCGLAVLIMIAWIAREAVTYSGEPPELSAAVLDVAPSGENYRVTIEVRNHAASTAASVSVRGELREAGNAVLETSDITIDYVPARSSATAALLFQNDPRNRRLIVRPMGYVTP